MRNSPFERRISFCFKGEELLNEMSFHAENPASYPTGANHLMLKRLYLGDVSLRRLVTILLVLHVRKLRSRTQSENKYFQRKDGGDFLSNTAEIILPGRLRMVIGLINLENYPLAVLT